MSGLHEELLSISADAKELADSCWDDSVVYGTTAERAFRMIERLANALARADNPEEQAK